MGRGFWLLLAVMVCLVGWSGGALAQGSAPVILEKSAIQQRSGAYNVSASGSYKLADKTATQLECRIEVQWILNGDVVTPAAGAGIGTAADNQFSGNKQSSTMNTQALPQVRVSIWGVPTSGGAKIRLSPWTAWETMPRQ